MKEQGRYWQAVAAILFSLLIAWLLALGGLLGGSYLCSLYGPLSDETDTYVCGVLLGGVLAIGGGITLLWKFWPRAPVEKSWWCLDY